MTPTDQDAYYSYPELFMPKYDEVHISCTFTWDIEKSKELAYQWGRVAIWDICGAAQLNL